MYTEQAHRHTPILLLNDPCATAEQRDDFSTIKSPNNIHRYYCYYYFIFIFRVREREGKREKYYKKKSAQALNYAIFHIGRK